MKINLNKLAVAVTEKEGGKVKLPVAQVKEVLRLALDEMRKFPGSAVMELMERK